MMKQSFDPKQSFKAMLCAWLGLLIGRLALPPEIQGPALDLVAATVGFVVDAAYFWLVRTFGGPRPWIGLVLVFLMAPMATHAQTTQIRVGGAWSPRYGFSERLTVEPVGWRLRDVAGVRGFDLHPFTWGSPSGRSMGGGVFWQVPAARNAWLRVGPEIEFRQGAKPAGGVFLGLTIDVFGGR